MQSKKGRFPKYAGSFYPSNKKTIENEVLNFFKNTQARKSNTIAVVSPHAGYVFSGQVAAEAINQLDPDKNYENVFIIGISHHFAIEGASVYTKGNYDMPFGTIKVNIELAKKFINENNYFLFNKDAHEEEHCIEVQLPFLHYHLKKDFKIVPILIGTGKNEILESIAETIKPYFNKNNAFIFSTDFSHYPTYKDAVEADKKTAEGLISNDIQKFLNAINENSEKKIPRLVTSACGKNDLLILLNLTKNDKNYKYEIISYKNSGDSPFGGKDSVVGYYAIAVRKNEMFQLSKKEKETLLKISRETLIEYIQNNRVPKIDKSLITENLNKNIGAFVTLKIDGNLRGCIGRFMPDKPLWKTIQDMTVASATQDNRFPIVNEYELDKIDIEISVLTPLQKINSIEEVVVGRDGIYIRKGPMGGTLLPQVASDNNWDRIEFLEYCSKYKAGLGKDGWKEADLFIYQAIIFEEKEL